MSVAEKIQQLVELEWQFFQEVHNEGGRADCQNNWPTFRLMRSSQFVPWPEPLIDSYLKDLQEASHQGRNPLTEKYAWMMARTAPAAFERLQHQLPPLAPEAVTLINEIIPYHLQWMAEYHQRYPHLAATNRAATSAEDTSTDTSFETYLEGELKTYSLNTLRLYLAFVRQLAANQQNLALLTMDATVKGYGYASLDAAESTLSNAQS